MVKKAGEADCGILAGLAIQMWKDNDISALSDEFRELARSGDAACFIKYADGKPAGFAECRLRRDYVEGTETSPVGYLEGIFITGEYRQLGYAKELLLCCEKWAREKNCSEFASDCELANEESLRFHIAAGFEEANRIICFRKDL